MARKKSNSEGKEDSHQLLPLDFSFKEENEFPFMRDFDKDESRKKDDAAKKTVKNRTGKDAAKTKAQQKEMSDAEEKNTSESSPAPEEPRKESLLEESNDTSLREEMLASAPKRIVMQARTINTPPPEPPPAPPPSFDSFKIEPVVIPLNMQAKPEPPKSVAPPPPQKPPESKPPPSMPPPPPAKKPEPAAESGKKTFWEPQKREPVEERPKSAPRSTRLFDPDTIFSDDDDDEPFPSPEIIKKNQEPRLTPYGRKHIGADMFDKGKEPPAPSPADKDKEVKKAADVFEDESEGNLLIPISAPPKRGGVEEPPAQKAAAREKEAPKPQKEKRFLSKLPLFKPLKAKEPVQIIACISGENATPGQILQEARIRCGYSINQVEQETKIRLDYLEALENDEYKKLPPIVYINAYIKNLGSLYNLSPEVANNILNAIRKDGRKMTAEEILKDDDTDMPPNPDAERMRQFLKMGSIAAIVVMALVVGGLSAMLFMSGQKGARFEEEEIEPEPPPQKKVVKDEPPSEPVVKQQTDGAAKSQATVFTEADFRKFMPSQTITMTELSFEADKN